MAGGGARIDERGDGPAPGGKGKTKPPKKTSGPANRPSDNTDSGYTPTGGRWNDPDTWKTNPGYGQGFGEANKGAGYNPAYGSYEDYKAARRDWRARFQPGGANYEKDQLIKASILGARPNSEAALGALLNKLGIFDAKEQGQSYYRKTMMDYKNLLSGNMQIDPETGMGLNVGTSDVNSEWQHLTPEQQAELGRGFFGRLADELGVPRFNAWQMSGKGSAEGITGNGLYYNYSPGGGITYWDKEGYTTDATGKRTGDNYMFGNAGGVAGAAPYGAPVGTDPGHILPNNPAQNPGDNGYNAPPTGTNGVPATAIPASSGSILSGTPGSIFRSPTANSPRLKKQPPGTQPDLKKRPPGTQDISNMGMGVANTSMPAPMSGANPGSSSLPSGWGGGSTAYSQPQNAVPTNTTATGALPGTVQTRTRNRLRPLEQAPQQTNPAYNPNLLRLSMLGGRQPLVV